MLHPHMTLLIRRLNNLYARVDVMTSEVANCKHAPWGGTIPLVSVLVLNWRGRRFLKPCFASLIRDVCPHVELLLIDNGSDDGSVDLVKTEFPQVRVISYDVNLGFSRGYNAAVPLARGRFMVFLNNDTEVKEGWLFPLIDALRERPDIGIASSKLVFFGTHLLNGVGGYLKLWTGGGELGFGDAEESFPVGGIIEPFYGSGAALAIRRELFERTGGFDDEMFAYGEDLDLSWRVRLAGYHVKCIPGSVVYHHFSSTLGGVNPAKFKMGVQHYIRAMLKCLSYHNLLHALPIYLVFALIKGGMLSLLTRNQEYLINVFIAFRCIAYNVGEICQKRNATQRLRVVSDRRVFASDGFGLFDAPWHFFRLWRILGSVRRTKICRKVER
ncbi:MAG TPA: glycosyltransferase family 2 protein [bacterium]|nr:glycosyltransferase family 2 protein [bacterium]